MYNLALKCLLQIFSTESLHYLFFRVFCQLILLYLYSWHFVLSPHLTLVYSAFAVDYVYPTFVNYCPRTRKFEVVFVSSRVKLMASRTHEWGVVR